MMEKMTTMMEGEGEMGKRRENREDEDKIIETY